METDLSDDMLSEVQVFISKSFDMADRYKGNNLFQKSTLLGSWTNGKALSILDLNQFIVVWAFVINSP